MLGYYYAAGEYLFFIFRDENAFTKSYYYRYGIHSIKNRNNSNALQKLQRVVYTIPASLVHIGNARSYAISIYIKILIKQSV